VVHPPRRGEPLPAAEPAASEVLEEAPVAPFLLPITDAPLTASEASAFSLPEETRGAQLLIFDLFTGMDGLGHALDLLGTQHCFPTKAVCLLFEVDDRCRQILKIHRVRPGVLLSSLKDDEGVVGSALAPSQDSNQLLRSILSQLPSLRIILLVGGSPCVGFSRANAKRAGIFDPQSEKMWAMPVLASKLRALTSENVENPVEVIYFVENVVMSDTPADVANCKAVSETMGVPPVLIQAGLRCMADRERNYWTNLQVPLPLPPLVLDVGLFLAEGWRPIWEFPSGIPMPEKRFATFLRPLKPFTPKEYPAPFTRLSLHAYSDRGLLYRPDTSGKDLLLLKELVSQCVRIKTKDLRDPNASCVKARIRLVEEIHLRGADRFLRPLTGPERDLCLGFPAGASSLPTDAKDGFVWEPLQATGNAFAVPIIAHILQPIARFLLREDCPIPEVLPGFPTVASKEEAVFSLSPAAALHPSGNKSRRSKRSRPVAS
jgi:hypothetical protein